MTEGLESGELTAWIRNLFEDPDMLRMGHDQRGDDLNLGLGWVYYALGRALRPQHALVIGSYRGFVPLIIAKALRDNLEGGTVTFIDPSLVDDFWKDADRVAAHFASHDLDNVTHHALTTQDFVRSDAYRTLAPVGLLFVDGLHTREQAKLDHEAFEDRLTPTGVTVFHDSMVVGTSTMYGDGRSYDLSVPDYLDELRRGGRHAVFDLPLAQGVALVRRVEDPGRGPRRPHRNGPAAR